MIFVVFPPTYLSKTGRISFQMLLLWDRITDVLYSCDRNYFGPITQSKKNCVTRSLYLFKIRGMRLLRVIRCGGEKNRVYGGFGKDRIL